jgi:hypothetical protein
MKSQRFVFSEDFLHTLLILFTKVNINLPVKLCGILLLFSNQMIYSTVRPKLSISEELSGKMSIV